MEGFRSKYRTGIASLFFPAFPLATFWEWPREINDDFPASALSFFTNNVKTNIGFGKYQ